MTLNIVKDLRVIQSCENQTDKLIKKRFNKFTHAKKEEKEAKNNNSNKASINNNNNTRSRFNKNKKTDKEFNSSNNPNTIKFQNVDVSNFKEPNLHHHCIDNLIDLNHTKEDSFKNTSRSESLENNKRESNVYYYSKGFTTDSKEIFKNEENEYANVIGFSKSSKYYFSFLLILQRV